ncbi:MAG TPA: hypothetical protein VFB73_11155 [Chloroflexota bacterium]|nr:hypothetical protein [Chloroflexota bacterium]
MAALEQAAVLAAQEVVVTLGGPLPADVEGWLRARRARGRPVVVLCGPWREPAYLRALLRLGCQVYDAVIEARSLLFLDRQQGFQLPEGTPIARPFETACALLWQRIGAYCHFEGPVSAVYPAERLFQLAQVERAWLAVPEGQPLPAVGDRLSVLARVFWAGSSSLAQVFEAVACWPSAAANPQEDADAG